MRSTWLRKVGLIAVLLVVALAGNGSTVYALTNGAVRDIKRKTPLFSFEEAGCGAKNVGGPGTLPKIIPEPYNAAFTNGARKFNVSPALVAAIFTEENFTKTPVEGLAKRWAEFPSKHPDPNSGWPTSSAQAKGPFQFLLPTWYDHRNQVPSDFDEKKDGSIERKDINSYGYGSDGDGNKQRDPLHLADGAAGAAKMMASYGATIDTAPVSWREAIYHYNKPDWYYNEVITYYNFYNAGGGSDVIQTITSTPQPSSTCTASQVGNVNCAPGGGSTTPGLSEVRSKVVCIALDELARWERKELVPNSGARKYLAGNGLDNWCGYFASWVYNQAGYPLTNKRDGNEGLVQNIWDIGRKNEKFHFHSSDSGYVPRPGDLTIHKEGGTSHVNIVVEVEGTDPRSMKIVNVGGNQQSNSFYTSVVSKEIMRGVFARDTTGFVSPD